MFRGNNSCRLVFLRLIFAKGFNLFDDGGPYHTETSPLICEAYQWIGFYMIGTIVAKELKNFLSLKILFYWGPRFKGVARSPRNI